MKQKTKNFKRFSCHKENFLNIFLNRSNHDQKFYNMIYHSTLSYDYLGKLILFGKKEKKVEKTKTYTEYKISPHFSNGRNKNLMFFI